LTFCDSFTFFLGCRFEPGDTLELLQEQTKSNFY
jgi:hypothetical protein